MSERFRLTIAGILFLAAFPLYGGGQALIEAGNLQLGLVLCLLNSLGVIFIAILMRPIIAADDPGTANIYLAARLFEGSALAAGAVSLVGFADHASSGVFNSVAYHLGMLVLALGSIPFCIWLGRFQRLHSGVALAGVGGYILLSAGMVADHFGQTEISLYLLIPGALFEATLSILLILGRAARPDPKFA